MGKPDDAAGAHVNLPTRKRAKLSLRPHFPIERYSSLTPPGACQAGPGCSVHQSRILQ